MSLYSTIPATLAILLLIFSAKHMGAVGPVLYQLLMASAVTAIFMAPAAAEGAIPGNLGRAAFLWLGLMPSVVQMGLTALYPDFFWFNFLAYLLLAGYYLDMKKRRSKLPKEQQPKPQEPSFHLPNKLYVMVFMLALPLGAVDYRYFLPVFSAWTFALWCFKNI